MSNFSAKINTIVKNDIFIIGKILILIHISTTLRPWLKLNIILILIRGSGHTHQLKKNEEWFELEEFKKIGLLGTQHVNFLGKYIFEDNHIDTDDALRPLKIMVKV